MTDDDGVVLASDNRPWTGSGSPERDAASDGRQIQPVQQTIALARRSVVGMLRQPALLVPALFFPMLIAAINGAALGRAIRLPGFPEGLDSFYDFILPATVVQGVLFGGVAGGSDVALDIENGFFERLVASPVWRASILVGRLGGAAALGAVQAVAFMAAFVTIGVTIRAGVAGVLVIVVTAVLLAVGVGGLAAAVGLRTGSAEAVQNSFPLVFILLFISSAFFPTALMKGWYKSVATHNPISALIDGLRHQVIYGFDGGKALQSIGIAAAVAVFAIALAVRQLQRRLAVAA